MAGEELVEVGGGGGEVVGDGLEGLGACGSGGETLCVFVRDGGVDGGGHGIAPLVSSFEFHVSSF